MEIWSLCEIFIIEIESGIEAYCFSPRVQEICYPLNDDC
jgi:hypothetical protein